MDRVGVRLGTAIAYCRGRDGANAACRRAGRRRGQLPARHSKGGSDGACPTQSQHQGGRGRLDADVGIGTSVGGSGRGVARAGVTRDGGRVGWAPRRAAGQRWR